MGTGCICRRQDRCRLRVTADFQTIQVTLAEVPDRVHRADGKDMSLTECDAGKECRDQHQVDQGQNRESGVHTVHGREAERREENGKRYTESSGNTRQHVTTHHDLFRCALRDPHQQIQYEKADRIRCQGKSFTGYLTGNEHDSVYRGDQDDSEEKALQILKPRTFRLRIESYRSNRISFEKLRDQYIDTDDAPVAQSHEEDEPVVRHESGKQRRGFGNGIFYLIESGHIPEHSEELDRLGCLHVGNDRGDHGDRLEYRKKRKRKDSMSEQEASDRLSLHWPVSVHICPCTGYIILLLFLRALQGLPYLFIRLGFHSDREHFCRKQVSGYQKTDHRKYERGHDTYLDRQEFRCIHQAVADAEEVSVDRDEIIDRIGSSRVHAGYAGDKHDQEDRQKCRLRGYDRLAHTGDHDRNGSHQRNQ